ncbi:MAG TPA: hypothetical protein VK841_04660 [Polyangiaceae bacterium]|jgi:hypothetical protein|nr:hypothetical protein [Polyangiaceae bacterium]
MNDSWRRLAGIARFAPTPHNTQPFRIRPRSETQADVVVLKPRLLPKEDHGNLYMTSAIGIFCETVDRAGAAIGLDVTTALEPTLEPARLHEDSAPDVVARIDVRGPIEPRPEDGRLIAHVRRTSRHPYDATPVAGETLARLAAGMSRYGQALDIESGAAPLAQIMDWNAASVIDNLQIDDERREIQGWYRTGPTPALGDGLWNGPFCQPAWEVKFAFAAPRLLAWPGVRTLAEARFKRSQRALHVAFLRGPFRTAAELFGAGRGLMDLWIAMAREGVFMHPMGSMLTNPDYAARVARLVGHDDVWLVVRLGHSAEPEAAPRLAAEEIVIR